MQPSWHNVGMKKKTRNFALLKLWNLLQILYKLYVKYPLWYLNINIEVLIIISYYAVEDEWQKQTTI